MKVRVQFYAQLRDLAGVQALDVDLAEDAQVSDLLEKLYAKFPGLRDRAKGILVGAGVEFVDRDHKLRPSDEIAVMPPVQGG
jgi:molybdopterin converting factor small subunit